MAILNGSWVHLVNQESNWYPIRMQQETCNSTA